MDSRWIVGEIDDTIVEPTVEWLINTDGKSRNSQTLFINSTGGDMYAAFAIADVIQQRTHPIKVVGIGAVMSSAMLLLSSGRPGLRFVTVNTVGMIHEYSWTVEGRCSHMDSDLRWLQKMNQKMKNFFEANTKLKAKDLAKYITPADHYFDSEELIKFGFADHLWV